MEEAESAMTRLCKLVEQVLASNRDMSRRLRHMDDKSVPISHSLGLVLEDDASTPSSRTVTPPPPGLPPGNLPENVQRSKFGFAFEEELFASCVYRKPLFSDSRPSLVTSAARTTASSVLSALSLTDISNISILAVPIYADEISNQDRYTSEDLDREPSNLLRWQTAVQSQKNALAANRWEGYANAVSRRRLDKDFSLGASQEPDPILRRRDNWPIQPVLGASLSEVIKFANVAMFYYNGEDKSFEYASLPVYMVEIGEFLIEKGMICRPTTIYDYLLVIEPDFDDILTGKLVENIFCISGTESDVQNLQGSFTRPPRYGWGMYWRGYTVHDAASTMLRFLNRLPEPVIPLKRYEAFQKPLKQNFLDWRRTTESPTRLPISHIDKSVIQEYRRQITLLPEASRHVLMYLLDTFAVIASHSESNKMTSSRIAKVFQPVILSPVKAGEYFIGDDKFSELSHHVLTFLIDFHEYLLVGMTGMSTRLADGTFLPLEKTGTVWRIF